jgi:hypothetical protein
VQAASATQSAAVLPPQRKLLLMLRLLMLRLLMQAQVVMGRGASGSIYTAFSPLRFYSYIHIYLLKFRKKAKAT